MRLGLLLILVTALAFVGWCPEPSMADDAVLVEQRQLADAQCWNGPIDGVDSAKFRKARDGCPPLTPFLRLAGPTHLGVVQGVAANADCSTLLTVSMDKTARIWNGADGTQRSIIRPPIGTGSDGAIYAVALSPNGRLAALGLEGYTTRFDGSQAVAILDLATSTMIARVGPLHEAALDLEFSPDGSRLAVNERHHGLHVFATDSWQEISDDLLKGGVDFLVGLAFGPDGSLYTFTNGGVLSRFDQDGKQPQRAIIKGKIGGMSAAVDPTGRLIALGFYDQNEIALVDATTLKEVSRIPGPPRQLGYPGGIVAFNAKGLLAMTTGRLDNGTLTIRVMAPDPVEPNGWRQVSDTPVTNNTIFALKPCGDGFAFGSGEPALGVISPDHGLVWSSRGIVADMTNKLGPNFTISVDAARVRFGLKEGLGEPVLFDLDQETLTDSPVSPPGMIQADTKSLRVERWFNSTEVPLLEGKPIAFETGNMARAVAIAPGGDGIVLGTSSGIERFDRAGKSRWSRSQGLDETYGLDIAGSTVVSAHADGTLRWRRLSDGKEFLALFIEPLTRRWVAFTPEGYYMASPGGDDLIGWQINRGWGQSGDFFPVSRFRERYYRPDIVNLAFSTQDSKLAADRLGNTNGHTVRASVVDSLPPIVKIVAPKSGSTINNPNLVVDFSVRSPSGKSIDGLEALIDNRPAQIEDSTQSRDNDAAGAQWTGRLRITFPTTARELGLLARAGGIAGETDRVKLVAPADGPPSASDLLKPKLYALVVGVSRYQSTSLKPLTYAAKDAADLASLLKSAKGSLYGDAEVKLLTDDTATIQGVKEGLAWLERSVRRNDIGLVYLAGHGLTDATGTYWFMASDSEPATSAPTGISGKELLESLPNLAGQPVMLLDTCYSGAAAMSAATKGSVDINGIVSDLSQSDNRVITLAAASGREISQENPIWGNGAFTKAVIEGLRDGKAELGPVRDGKIRISQLRSYVAQRVGDLTNFTQHPVLNLPDPSDDPVIWAVH